VNTWDELVERVEADRLLGTLSDEEIVAMGAATRARFLGRSEEPMSRPRAMSASVRDRKRRALIRRDGATCAYCGRPLGTGLPYSRPTLDHVVPVSRGGGDALTNLVLACKPCNRAKADKEE
jgi:hypothetical protein